VQSFQLVRKFVFQKYAALRSAKVCTTLPVQRVVEGLVYNTNSGPHVYANSNHTSDVMKVTLSKAFGPVEWVNPDDHLILVELIRKLKEVPV
jgi:hypothetical protein